MKTIDEKEFSELGELSKFIKNFSVLPPDSRVTFYEFISQIKENGLLETLIGYGLDRLVVDKSDVQIFLSFWSLYDKESSVRPCDVLDLMDNSDKISVRNPYGYLNDDNILRLYAELVYGFPYLSNLPDKALKRIGKEFENDDKVFTIGDFVYILKDRD